MWKTASNADDKNQKNEETHMSIFVYWHCKERRRHSLFFFFDLR